MSNCQIHIVDNDGIANLLKYSFHYDPVSLRFKDKNIQNIYDSRFMKRLYYIPSIVSSIVTLPLFLLRVRFPTLDEFHSTYEVLAWSVFMIGWLASQIFLVYIIYSFGSRGKSRIDSNDPSITQSKLRYEIMIPHSLAYYLYGLSCISITLSFGVVLIDKTQQGVCERNTIFENYNCNSDLRVSVIPADHLLTILLTPMILQIFLQTNRYITAINWIISICCVNISAYVTGTTHSTWSALLSFLTIISMYSIEESNMIRFRMEFYDNVKDLQYFIEDGYSVVISPDAQLRLAPEKMWDQLAFLFQSFETKKFVDSLIKDTSSQDHVIGLTETSLACHLRMIGSRQEKFGTIACDKSIVEKIDFNVNISSNVSDAAVRSDDSILRTNNFKHSAFFGRLTLIKRDAPIEICSNENIESPVNKRSNVQEPVAFIEPAQLDDAIDHNIEVVNNKETEDMDLAETISSLTDSINNLQKRRFKLTDIILNRSSDASYNSLGSVRFPNLIHDPIDGNSNSGSDFDNVLYTNILKRLQSLKSKLKIVQEKKSADYFNRYRESFVCGNADSIPCQAPSSASMANNLYCTHPSHPLPSNSFHCSNNQVLHSYPHVYKQENPHHNIFQRIGYPMYSTSTALCAVNEVGDNDDIEEGGRGREDEYSRDASTVTSAQISIQLQDPVHPLDDMHIVDKEEPGISQMDATCAYTQGIAFSNIYGFKSMDIPFESNDLRNISCRAQMIDEEVAIFEGAYPSWLQDLVNPIGGRITMDHLISLYERIRIGEVAIDDSQLHHLITIINDRIIYMDIQKLVGQRLRESLESLLA